MKTDVSEELLVSIIKMKRFRELKITLAVTSNATEARCKDILTLRNVLQWLVNSNVVPSGLILVTLIFGGDRFPETLIFTRATLPKIPEDVILQQTTYFLCKI
jgi:hypothetical protein